MTLLGKWEGSNRTALSCCICWLTVYVFPRPGWVNIVRRRMEGGRRLKLGRVWDKESHNSVNAQKIRNKNIVDFIVDWSWLNRDNNRGGLNSME